jgi:hypothetical protein
MDAILVADIETDSLDARVIHAIGILDYNTNEYTCYAGDELPDGLLRLEAADIIIGHWFSEFDAPTIERITKGLIRFDYKKIVDTVKLSKALVSELPNHKLETYGDIFGFPKLHQKDYSTWTPKFAEYLERDVRLNKLVFDFLYALVCEGAA